MSFSKMRSNSSCLISSWILSPSMLKLYPLMAEDIAMTIVSRTNFMAPSPKSASSRMLSTICPLSIGSNTMQPEEMSRATLAIPNKPLLRQLYLKRRLYVCPACFALRAYFSLLASCSMRVDRVLPYSCVLVVDSSERLERFMSLRSNISSSSCSS